MRTTDFSKAPKQARGEALVIVETVPANVPSSTRWFAARASARSSTRAAAVRRLVMRRAIVEPEYVWHKTYRRPNGVRGVIVFFGQRRAAEEFRATLDRASVRVRLLVAEPSGYSNGVWRAEGNVMAHIEHFTPTSVESARGSTPPLVANATPQPRSPGHRQASSSASLAAAPARSRSSTSAVGSGRPVTDARAMFVGATKYRGPRALLTLSRTWYPMIARMQKLHGYVWHTVYWQPPFTLGTLAFFATRDDLLSFARLPAHRQLMQWITRDTKNGTGGYIRLQIAPDLDDEPASATKADAIVAPGISNDGSDNDTCSDAAEAETGRLS
ncbi:MAG: hypothetical protein JWQ64_775 [Subtercola sp.]|nr:hypothetical protein [Subtercola sp.]